MILSLETRPDTAADRLAPDVIEHLQVGAVQMGDERTLGPNPSDGLVHRRQVMKVNDVDLTEACALKDSLPRRHLSLRLLRA